MAKKRAKTPKRQSSSNLIGSGEMDRYRAAFLKLDEDGSLTISVEELFVAMRTIGLRLKISDIAEMIGEGDTNNDDELDFDEFVQVMEAAKNLRSSKAWISAYEKFVGRKSQTLKTGFLFDQQQSKQPPTPSVSASITNSTVGTPWWNSYYFSIPFVLFLIGFYYRDCDCQGYIDSYNNPNVVTIPKPPDSCNCGFTFTRTYSPAPAPAFDWGVLKYGIRMK